MFATGFFKYKAIQPVLLVAICYEYSYPKFVVINTLVTSSLGIVAESLLFMLILFCI